MKNKKLFIFSLPILLPIVTILVLLWINYFSDTFVHANEKAISSVFGVLMMILGFYISIVLFIATDDKEKVEANIQNFITENPAWSELTAVKEGRVYMMEKDLYTLKPNDRWGEAYEKLEAILAGETK